MGPAFMAVHSSIHSFLSTEVHIMSYTVLDAENSGEQDSKDACAHETNRPEEKPDN